MYRFRLLLLRTFTLSYQHCCRRSKENDSKQNVSSEDMLHRVVVLSLRNLADNQDDHVDGNRKQDEDSEEAKQ